MTSSHPCVLTVLFALLVFPSISGHTHPWCIFIKKRTGPFPAFRTRQQARAFPPHAPRVVSSPLPPPPNPAVVLNYSHQAIPYLGNNRDEPLLILPRFQTELLCFLCELGVSRAAKVSPPNPGRRSSRPRGLRQPPPCRGPSGVRRGCRAPFLTPPSGPVFQYGFINTCLESLVKEEFGEETWERLR